MGKPNIFLISPRATEEDRFTKHWEYLLFKLPNLGQEIIDFIASKSNLPPTKYIRSIDHPFFNNKTYPDFCFICTDHIILFEHKLKSELRKNQLQDYCKLNISSNSELPPKPIYVALISDNPGMKFDKNVLNYTNYIFPKDLNRYFFLWKDFYEIVKEHHDSLSNEFAIYMEEKGMVPLKLGPLGDIFADENAKKKFKDFLSLGYNYLRNRGFKCFSDRKSLGFQIQQPFPPIRVIHLIVDSITGHLEHSIKGHGLFLEVKGFKGENYVPLDTIDTEIQLSFTKISIKSPEPYKPVKNYVLFREYAAEIEAIFDSNIEKAESNFKEFLSKCIEHIKRSSDNILKVR
jgi:hypothetical protein